MISVEGLGFGCAVCKPRSFDCEDLAVMEVVVKIMVPFWVPLILGAVL